MNMISGWSLNPCCNGIYSMRLKTNLGTKKASSLNPCCNGIYSMSEDSLKVKVKNDVVLILVVMEYTQ